LLGAPTCLWLSDKAKLLWHGHSNFIWPGRPGPEALEILEAPRPANLGLIGLSGTQIANFDRA